MATFNRCHSVALRNKPLVWIPVYYSKLLAEDLWSHRFCTPPPCDSQLQGSSPVTCSFVRAVIYDMPPAREQN